MGRRPRRPTPQGVAEIDGYVVVDKPSGMTSHDVVARARRLLMTRRVGHAGTLDPGATGVLVLGVGRATRLLRFVSDLQKSYCGEIVFGSTTTTLDDEGEVTERYDMSGLSIDRIREAAACFVGTIQQVPPMVSAIKIGGKRLHDLARQGIEVERAPRTVTISRFDIEPTGDPYVISFEVDCSSGTYVRSLAADLGQALDGGAHLRHLQRTAIGRFTLGDACSLETLTRDDVKPPAGLVSQLDSIVVDDARLSDVAHGKVMDRRALEVVGDGPWVLQTRAGRLLAIYESWTTERIKPAVVLIDPDEESAMNDDHDRTDRVTDIEPDGR